MNIKENIRENGPDKLLGIAAIIQACPLLVYIPLTILVVTLGYLIYILVAWVSFIVLLVVCVTCSIICSIVAIKLTMFVYTQYHHIRMMFFERQKETKRVDNLQIKNDREEAMLALDLLVPRVLNVGLEAGKNVTYSRKGELAITDWKSSMSMLQSGNSVIPELEAPVKLLPTYVRYEDIRHEIPDGHNVVGISEKGLITKEDRHIGACVWIVGGSGSGKTSTTSLRLEERASCGHNFYGVDPHWFKDDSLTNAVVGFADRFLLPMARDAKEAKIVLETFLKEFQDRKAGKVTKPFQKVTLVVDEVGSLNDPQCEEEEDVLKLLKTITRVCGQEARNFNMGGIFISQQATGLYWIGNVALLIIVHKLLKENQQKLATQTDDKELFAAMRLWPKGRSYVYGMGLEEGEGCLTMQQPYFEKITSGSWNFEKLAVVEEVVEACTNLDVVYEACMKLKEDGTPVKVDTVTESLSTFSRAKVGRLMKQLVGQGIEIR